MHVNAVKHHAMFLFTHEIMKISNREKRVFKALKCLHSNFYPWFNAKNLSSNYKATHLYALKAIKGNKLI